MYFLGVLLYFHDKVHLAFFIFVLYNTLYLYIFAFGGDGMAVSSYNDSCQSVRNFLSYIGTVRNNSSKTVDEYHTDLRTFFRFMKQYRGLISLDTPFEEISVTDISVEFIASVTLTDILEYMNFLRTERNNNAKTRSRKVSSLRSFYKYMCNKTNEIERNPTLELETPKQKKALPRHLSLEQSVSLLESVDGPQSERDYCIITIFLNCGLRLSELVGLDIGRINFDEKSMIVLGKGNKERLVYLNDNCLQAIRVYLKVRPTEVKSPSDARALFLSRIGKRISPKTVQWIIKRQLKEAGLDGMGFSTHKLRHTAATLMYQHGHVDIRVLKDMLGHENLGTTEIYTHLSTEQLEKAANASPLATVKIKPKKETDDD